MPRLPLSSAPKPRRRYYLDTSALFALASEWAGTKGQPAQAKEIARAVAMKPFLHSVANANGSIRTSTLAFQEIASVQQRRARNFRAGAAGHGDWHNLLKKGVDPTVVLETAKRDMLQFLTYTVRAMHSVGCKVEEPPVGALATAKVGTLRREAHRRLLRLHPGLDSMDALHIVVGYQMGARDFVTFDDGWTDVQGITVYG